MPADLLSAADSQLKIIHNFATLRLRDQVLNTVRAYKQQAVEYVKQPRTLFTIFALRKCTNNKLADL